jgi:hypothetical protein
MQAASLRPTLSQTQMLRQLWAEIQEAGEIIQVIIPLIAVSVSIGQILLHDPLFRFLQHHLLRHDMMKSGIRSLHMLLLFDAKVDDHCLVFRQKGRFQARLGGRSFLQTWKQRH